MNINNAVETAIELGESEIRHNQKEIQIRELLTETGLSRYTMVPIPSAKNPYQYLIRLKPYLGFVEWQSNPNTPGILTTVDTSSKPENIKKRFEHVKRMIEAELLSKATTLAYKEFKDCHYASTDLAKILHVIALLEDKNNSLVEIIYLQKLLVEMTEAMPAWFKANGFVLDNITFNTFKYECIDGKDPLLVNYLAGKHLAGKHLAKSEIKVNQKKLVDFKDYCTDYFKTVNEVIGKE